MLTNVNTRYLDFSGDITPAGRGCRTRKGRPVTNSAVAGKIYIKTRGAKMKSSWYERRGTLTILATVNRGKLFVDVASRARKRKTQGTSVGSLSEFRHGGAAPDAPNQRSIKQSLPYPRRRWLSTLDSTALRDCCTSQFLNLRCVPRTCKIRSNSSACRRF